MTLHFHFLFLIFPFVVLRVFVQHMQFSGFNKGACTLLREISEHAPNCKKQLMGVGMFNSHVVMGCWENDHSWPMPMTLSHIGLTPYEY